MPSLFMLPQEASECVCLINVFFPDEEVTANDLYFVCYMVEYIARRLKQPNRYVVNAMGKRSLQEKLSLAGVLHCENPEAAARTAISRRHQAGYAL